MTEQLLIEHGAPTLAGLKPGNLIQIPVSETLEVELADIRHRIASKKVALVVLRRTGCKASVYIFRPSRVREILVCPAVQLFLEELGYTDFTLFGALRTLKEHLTHSDFPHEIGIFLGYPLSDVIAFMQNGGRHCLVCGCWKAYSNECAARRTFERFERCRRIYTRLWLEGRSLEKLTVAG